MKILICVSGNAKDFVFEKNQVFVYEQIEAVRKEDVKVDYQVFALKGKGLKGYLSQLSSFKKRIIEYRPDLIHAHCGQMGLFANLQRRVPVVTTYHGSDINQKKQRLLSIVSIHLSKFNIFVSEKLLFTVKGTKTMKNSCVLPCGVDKSVFYPRKKNECKRKLGISLDERYVLFSSAFDNAIKNASLAKKVISHFPRMTLREIKNRSREEVAYLICGAELVLITSYSEGSPQIVKEAVACGQRVVSVDVGDIKDQLLGVQGCEVTGFSEIQLVTAIENVLAKNSSVGVLSPFNRYDNRVIANKLLKIYYSCL